MIFGRTKPEAATAARAAGAYASTGYTVPKGKLAKLSVYADGLNPVGSSPQWLCGFIASPANVVLATGVPVTVDISRPAGFVDLPFAVPLEFDGVTRYRLGVALGAGNAARLWRATGTAGQEGEGHTGTSNFPPTTLAANTASTTPPVIFATTFATTVHPADPEYLATLAFPEAQRLFAAGVYRITRRINARCGWHGTSLGPVGSYALVDPDGPLADLVGDVVRVGREGRAVYAYVYAQAAIAEDISLSRRLLAALGPLSADYITVSVDPNG